MDEGYKEVYFYQYCKTCEHYKKTESEDPCFECLRESVNLYSHKPTCYQEKQ